MFAKFSPDGSRVAYVSCNNLYVEDTNTGEIIQLTHDGNDKIINGTFDWVYEEEFACRDGFRWSPDGETIAFWNSDTDGTGFFDMINYTDSIYPRIIHFPYPKAGSRNSAVRVGYVSSRAETRNGWKSQEICGKIIFPEWSSSRRATISLSSR